MSEGKRLLAQRHRPKTLPPLPKRRPVPTAASVLSGHTISSFLADPQVVAKKEAERVQVPTQPTFLSIKSFLKQKGALGEELAEHDAAYLGVEEEEEELKALPLPKAKVRSLDDMHKDEAGLVYAAVEDEPIAIEQVENAIGSTAVNMVNMLKTARNGIVDLNSVAIELGTQKRRVYDIVNVLEGIGLIHKLSKSRVEWRGAAADRLAAQLEIDEEALYRDLELLRDEDEILDLQIARAESILQETADREYSDPNAFLTFQEIRETPGLYGKLLIGVRAPLGSTLTIPETSSSQTSGHEAFIQSAGGPIEIFVVSKVEEGPSTSTPGTPVHLTGSGAVSLPPSESTELVTSSTNWFLPGFQDGETIGDLFS